MSKKVSVMAPNELANWNPQHDCLLFEIPDGCKDLVSEGDLDRLFTDFERVFSKEMCSQSDVYALCIFKLFHDKIIDGLIVRRIDNGELN